MNFSIFLVIPALLFTPLFANSEPISTAEFRKIANNYNSKARAEILSYNLNKIFQRVTEKHFNPQETARSLFLIDSSPLELRKHYIAHHYLKERDTSIDAGAFVGAYSFFYSFLSSQGTVIAFEANPTPYSVIFERTCQSDRKNIYPLQKALSIEAGKILEMKVYPGHLKQSSTVEKSLMNSERMPGSPELINVETESLDHLYATTNYDEVLNRLKLIKIDTEGHETSILRGSLNLINKLRPVIIFEYGFDKGVIEPESIAILETLNYVCYDLKSLQRARPGHEELITDLVAIPLENLPHFENKLLSKLHEF